MVWSRLLTLSLSSRLSTLIEADIFEYTVNVSLLNLLTYTCDYSNLALAHIKSVPEIRLLSLICPFP